MFGALIWAESGVKGLIEEYFPSIPSSCTRISNSPCGVNTRQNKHCGFCIYIFDNYFDQSKSMINMAFMPLYM